MKSKLLDFVMSTVCDDYCRFPRLDDISDDELDKFCSYCPLAHFMSLLDLSNLMGG